MKPIFPALAVCLLIAACATPNRPAATSTGASDVAALVQQDGFVHQSANGKIKAILNKNGDITNATLFAVGEDEQPIRRTLPIGEIKETIEAAGCKFPSSFSVTTTMADKLIAHEVDVIC